NKTLRTTNDQNLVLPWVPDAALAALHAGLTEIELGSPDVASIDDVVSCPGMDYCSLAITRSMGMAERLRAHLHAEPGTNNGFAERLGPFAVKISGCPNSCGQHHVGDIGLTGHSVKTDDGNERPFYSILIGGAVGEGRARIGKRLGRFAEEDAPAVIAALARFYERERRDGESFAAFVDRMGTPRLQAVAEAGLGAGGASPAWAATSPNGTNRPRRPPVSIAITEASSTASTTAARVARCAATPRAASTASSSPSWRSSVPSRGSTGCARACASASISAGRRRGSASRSSASTTKESVNESPPVARRPMHPAALPCSSSP